jgi:YidC/Oxa1 family membrane protein insertase
MYKMVNFFIRIFNLIFYQPLLNILILFYQYLTGYDFGLAIILLTIFIKILFYPLTAKSIKSQKTLEGFQGKIQEIQEKYKDDKEKQARLMMELYQKEGINPFSGFLPLLVQLPILFALYQVFRKGLMAEEMVNLYSFVPRPSQINPYFLGILNLAQSSLILAVVAGILQYFQTKMTTPKTPKVKTQSLQFSEIIQKQTLYFFSFFTVLILWKLPAAVSLYWITTTLFSIIQQYLILRRLKYD